MQYLGKSLAITHEELTAVMTVSNINNLRHRRQLQQIRRACPGYPALFAVDSLPEKYKKQVLAMYPMPDKEIQSNFTIVADNAAVQFFGGFILDDGRHLPEAKVSELSTNAAILNAFDRMLSQSDLLNRKLGKKVIGRGDFWKRAAEHLLSVSEFNSLPRNARELQRKYNAYKQDGYRVLISNKFCSNNAAKIKDDAQISTLTQLLAISNNLNNAQIAAAYNQYAAANGWKPITDGAVSVWREKTDLTTVAGRRGLKTFANEKTMTIKRTRPTAPFLFWSLDGWDCELLYQDSKNGRTTYYNRLVLEVVLDPCCDYIIGYAIGIAENAQLITAALKNALLHSQQLFGTMHKIMQIQSDHFAMSAMKNVYAAVADKVTPARVGNAKAKPIERFFNYLNTTYCQFCSNWSGFGITTDRTKQPNSEVLNLRTKDFPDFDGVVAQIEQMIETDRRKKVEKFKEMYSNLTDDNRLTISREDWLYYFGETTGYTNRLSASGLTPTILGEKREYDCFNIQFRELAFVDWIVKYDPDDLDTVLAVNSDGSRRFILEKKYEQPMALADRKEGDAEQLQKVRDFNRELGQHVLDNLTKMADDTSKIVRLPSANDILKRFLITDSNGQHKTNKKLAALKEASGQDFNPDNNTPDYDMF
ncbi:MAG: hypothetical protein IKO99_12135 [Bacteroidales bacterium]|nr:hypothetical protein [Bacteroidales bacterium]